MKQKKLDPQVRKAMAEVAAKKSPAHERVQDMVKLYATSGDSLKEFIGVLAEITDEMGDSKLGCYKLALAGSREAQ
jgi:hypothetical protein